MIDEDVDYAVARMLREPISTETQAAIEREALERCGLATPASRRRQWRTSRTFVVATAAVFALAGIAVAEEVGVTDIFDQQHADQQVTAVEGNAGSKPSREMNSMLQALSADSVAREGVGTLDTESMVEVFNSEVAGHQIEIAAGITSERGVCTLTMFDGGHASLDCKRALTRNKPLDVAMVRYDEVGIAWGIAASAVVKVRVNGEELRLNEGVFVAAISPGEDARIEATLPDGTTVTETITGTR